MTGATKFNHFQTFQTEMETARLCKKIFRAFATDVKTAQFPRPRWIRRDSGNFQVFRDRGGDVAIFQTEAEMAQVFRPRRRRRDFPYRGGDDATKKQFFATVVKAARLSRSEWRRRDFPDQVGDGATFWTKSETARLFRPRLGRSDFPDHR